jgi:hypothetical protein
MAAAGASGGASSTVVVTAAAFVEKTAIAEKTAPQAIERGAAPLVANDPAPVRGPNSAARRPDPEFAPVGSVSAMPDETAKAPEPAAAVEAPAVSGAKTAEASKGDAAQDLRPRLAEALRTQGDDHLADALDHGQAKLEDGVIELRTLPDYRVVLEMELAVVEAAARDVLGAGLRVKLGGDLASSEQPAQPTPGASGNSGAARSGGGESAPGSPEAVQRALADPEVQRVQQLFTGQIREVRNLRGYTT